MPPTPPSFSVIIAAYQAAEFIGEAIESALDQEARPHEVIVGDDGSTDDLEGALRRFGGAVQLVRLSHGGEASAKNGAAAAATGDYLAFLDADDRFLPGRLEAMGELAAAEPDLDVITTDAALVHDGVAVGRCYGPHNPFPHDRQRTEILRRNFVFGLAAVRRSAFHGVGGFDPSIAYTTDWELWMRLILGGSRVGLVPRPLAEYRLHPGSMSAKRAEMARGRLATLEKVSQRTDLSPAERSVLEDTVEKTSALAAREDLRAALATGSPATIRTAARKLATDGRQSRSDRMKALAATLAPRRVSSSWQRRTAGSFVTVGDRRLPV